MLLMTSLLPASAQLDEANEAVSYDGDAALQISQAAIGRQLGDYVFTDIEGKQIRLADYAGTPLLISLVYTSCNHACPVTTRRLKKAVEAARQVLDEDSFRVVTIGFDTANDSPDRMRTFAREQRVKASGWEFLSADAKTMASLIDNLGFVYFPSPRGFDHITQVTVIDRTGVIYRQVYGEMFELPWLVEPLKDLVFDQPRSDDHLLAGLINRIRLFCTVYDPATGRYKIDYSLFIQIAIGLMIVLWVGIYLLRETRRARRR